MYVFHSPREHAVLNVFPVSVCCCLSLRKHTNATVCRCVAPSLCLFMSMRRAPARPINQYTSICIGGTVARRAVLEPSASAQRPTPKATCTRNDSDNANDNDGTQHRHTHTHTHRPPDDGNNKFSAEQIDGHVHVSAVRTGLLAFLRLVASCV